jgi:putative DNA modification/repair radical SAM protein
MATLKGALAPGNGKGLTQMGVREKLAILADAAKYDASCASGGGKRQGTPEGMGSVNGMGICHSFAPDGRCISLLKVLLTNHCIYDCSYCINRISSPVKRAKFTVQELVDLTLEFYRRNYIEGLFLSSGVFDSSDRTMEEMVAVARILRKQHRFNGYIHLKAVAGCATTLVQQAGRYADRLSANIELPTQADLARLAPAKTHEEVEDAMGTIVAGIAEGADDRRSGARAPAFAPAGQSTQMMVGATDTADGAILATASGLYQRFKLRRVYYSAFSPIPHGDPRLPLVRPPMIREHRLYQADWLMRHYGFSHDEIVPSAAQNLPTDLDPKTAWALRNRHLFPVDVNRADRAQLLRVPGIGVGCADKILRARRYRALRVADLGRMHVPMRRAKFFVVCADGHGATRKLDSLALDAALIEGPKQLSLFASAKQAQTGQL